MLFDGTDESLEGWKYAGGGRFVREDCTIKSVGAFGLLYTKQDYEAPYSLKLEWMMPGDDNSGVFVGFSDTGANTDQTSISQGEEIQIDATDNPAQTTGAIYLEQAPDIAAREAVLNPPGEWNQYEIVVAGRPHRRLPQRHEDQRVDRRRPERRSRHGPHRPADARQPATTSSSATCGSRTSASRSARLDDDRDRRPRRRSRSAAAATSPSRSPRRARCRPARCS